MKLQRTTIILVLVAIGLGGFVATYEFFLKEQQTVIQTKKQQIFSFSRDDVKSLTVKTTTHTINLERNFTSERPQWLMKSPQKAPANDAIVSYLLDALVKGKTEQRLSVSPNQLAEYGLSKPSATIEVILKNQQKHQISLGKSTFNNSYVYARIDSQTQNQGNIEVLIVSTDFKNAVNREIYEWTQPQTNIQLKPKPETLPPLPSPAQ
ncbi:DUF4340 domain-containing protein [Calothrix sp. 336/3]|uniref:DUF4340 domain-containing protein n=1 Tax=Calothrix sp. 336/3 TaxID=1337936 RepID=UPI0004E32794|nr:DUF4340 domain-containing protein [Calothrix sp. 336/3]AKG20525.1 hypothetical protein IJ00_03630 [Calothrix sp. 336/3]